MLSQPVRLTADASGEVDSADDYRFIRNFIAALDAPALDGPAQNVFGQAQFKVYRNTVALGALDALRANYPTTRNLVGDEWFDAVAHQYLRAHPPMQPCLLDYGRGFADFLLPYASSAELPYLAQVATLDRAWTDSHCAADATPLMIADVELAMREGAAIYTHPAAQAFWFADTPAAQLWCASRDGAEELASIEWRAGGVVLSRPLADVRWACVDEATTALCGRFVHGASLADALALEAVQFGTQAAGAALFNLISCGALTTAIPGALL